jgi:CheY-like chemotaxis protein
VRRRVRRSDGAGEARRQTALAQLGELALDSDASDPLLAVACALVQEALGADAAVVGERAADGLLLRASVGLAPEHRRDGPLAPPRGGHHLGALGFAAGLEVQLPGRLRPPLLLGAYRAAPRALGADATRFLEVVARLLSAALARLRAEHELLERERLLRAVFEAQPEPELLVDGAGAVCEANAAACRLLGRERRRLLGRSVTAGGAPLGAEALAALAGDRGPEADRALALAMTSGPPLQLHVGRVAAVAPGFTTVRLHAPPGAHAGREVEPPAARRVRILVVDDDPLVGTALARTLGDEHEVTVVEGAPAALARLDGGERFDAILSDLLMPEMSGLELYRALAARHPSQARRLAFLSGGACDDEVRAFLAAEDVPWLEKPFELSALRQLVAGRTAR